MKMTPIPELERKDKGGSRYFQNCRKKTNAGRDIPEYFHLPNGGGVPRRISRHFLSTNGGKSRTDVFGQRKMTPLTYHRKKEERETDPFSGEGIHLQQVTPKQA